MGKKGVKKILRRASLSPGQKEKKKVKKAKKLSSKSKEDSRDDDAAANDVYCGDASVYSEDDASVMEEGELFEVEAQELPTLSIAGKRPSETSNPSHSRNLASFDNPRDQRTPSIPLGCSLLFVAIARHEPEIEFHIISRYCEPKNSSFDEAEYMTYAYDHLGHIDDYNYSSIFASEHGNWFVKSDNGFIYIVLATPNYPRYFAVEVVDSLSNIITIGKHEYKRQMERGRQEKYDDRPNLLENINEWKNGLGLKVANHQRHLATQMGITKEESDYYDIVSTGDSNAKRHIEKQRFMKKKLHDYCEIVYKEYKDLQEGSKAYRLYHEIDGVKDEMALNIDALLQNIETLESVEGTCEDLLEASKVFKKDANELQWNMWFKDKGMLILGAGTAGAVALGATAGFLAGGPGGAALVTLPSVTAAEAIEASVLAGACGLAYYLTAKAAMHTWFWSKTFKKIT